MREKLVMVAVERETRDRIKGLAGMQPIYQYLDDLTKRATPYAPAEALTEKLERIEAKIDLTIFSPAALKNLTITPDMEVMIEQIYTQAGVKSIAELLDILKEYNEHGDEAERAEAAKVYQVFAKLFNMPNLPFAYVDLLMRRMFVIVEAINNPNIPKGEG